MCKILNTVKMGENTVIDCSPYNGDFLGAKTMIIVDAKNDKFKTNQFTVEKTRSCFSKGGSPWVMVFGSIPDGFLNVGNDIIFQ